MPEILYPPIEPYAFGHLDVGDGNLVYWEECGNPSGKPALVVHGGPGSGCVPAHRRHFDPARYRVVLFDQRGCGRSTPSAGDPATEMRFNTTDHLVADMEALREHLGIERWQLSGASWGPTLILAYAERHPERVSEIVLTAVPAGLHEEIGWLYRGLSLYFPAEWQRFRSGVPDEDLLGGYLRALSAPDRETRVKAAIEWHTWEDATIALEPHGSPGSFSDRPLEAMLTRARICAHYFANGCFLDDGVLLREAGKLAGIPGALLHGRLDMGSPVRTAWELAQVWPDAELHLFDDAGHTGTDAMTARKVRTLDAFAAR